MDYPIERKNKLIEYSLYLGCLLSNISQLPMFVRSGLTQQLAFPGWILLVIAIFLSGKVKINKSIMTQIGFGVALVVWLLMDSLLLSKTQFSSSMFYSYMISLFIFLLLVNDQFNSFIFNNVIFANRNVSNLNDLTSGRVSIISNFPKLITGNWLTGIGPTYYECFPLSAILQFGLIGGVLCILISLQPLVQSLRFRHISDEWFLLLLISAGYSVNGLFEGLTPFGPGVKCYYMWLLFGMLVGQRTRPMREGVLLEA